jgi:hypothetical protein
MRVFGPTIRQPALGRHSASVILLHGLGDTAEGWAPVGPQLKLVSGRLGGEGLAFGLAVLPLSSSLHAQAAMHSSSSRGPGVEQNGPCQQMPQTSQ